MALAAQQEASTGVSNVVVNIADATNVGLELYRTLSATMDGLTIAHAEYALVLVYAVIAGAFQRLPQDQAGPRQKHFLAAALELLARQAVASANLTDEELAALVNLPIMSHRPC